VLLTLGLAPQALYFRLLSQAKIVCAELRAGDYLLNSLFKE